VVSAAQRHAPPTGGEDLLHHADDLANALRERHTDDKRKGCTEETGGAGRKVEELIGKGKIRPPTTTQIRQAIAELAQAVRDAD
jgi:hypothetical protein